MILAPSNNNRWVYTMHGLEKRVNNDVSAGEVMAASVAMFAVLWLFVQTTGLFGPPSSIGAFQLPLTLENYFPRSTAPYSLADISKLSPGEPVVQIDVNMPPGRRLPPMDQATLNVSLKLATEGVSRLERLEMNLVGAGATLPVDSPAYRQYLYSRPNTDALDKALRALIVIGASTHLAGAYCARYGVKEMDCAHLLSALKLDGTPMGGSCHADQLDCDVDSEYRSLDGSCNNPQNPRWGSAFTAYGRFLFPRYADGIHMPRRERGVHWLPNPRAVSVALVTEDDRADDTKTLALATWTEFVAHDMAHTPVRKMIWTGKPISCCRDDGGWPLPRYIHPDCEAVSVAETDPVYGEQGLRCLNYVRSQPALGADCTFGPAQQMNQASHFLDGSTVYGSTLNKSSEVRAFESGLLRASVKDNLEYLPVAPKSLCGTKSCYLTGDERANSEPRLVALHTLWMREHNRVARQLLRLNPGWSDEVVYQEARRIVVAEIQHVTYNEWLPAVIGNRLAGSAGLGLTSNYSSLGYSPYKDPSVRNEAATAALRFVASLEQSKLSLIDDTGRVNDSARLLDHFNEPRAIETDDVLDRLVRGLATQGARKVDLRVISDVTQELYKTGGPVGLDQVAFDIQRGRDHGIPGYNEYRKHCGLKSAKRFDDFLDVVPTETVKKLQALYKHPDDVDLFVGGLVERAVEDGAVGPTFRCLLSNQFVRTRQSDRYFYDTLDQPKPFAPSQLESLKRASLARIFCDNGDSIAMMQPNVFLRPQKGNELESCHNFERIPSVDLFAWAEKAKAYR
ncbi:peroxidase-like isoform X2 [Copidosoma floridanum]|uniref:peroxidase-like isoform X2 n=1 Tax=Copidosoma floridanum TaxID=29053 RepID=UPI000C6F52E5|nr:peroxidase-like isoform X2 [Copidosoma floridanum]